MDECAVEQSVWCRRRRKESPARRWVLARNLVLGLSLAIACQVAFPQAIYRIKPLGYLGGCTLSIPYIGALNGAGQVTGAACNANGDSHAFLWKNDGTSMVDLGPDEVGSTSFGNALSPSGVVAGVATDRTGDFAFVSSGNGTSMKRIYSDGTWASSVNDLGQRTGYAYKAVGSYSFQNAIGWKNDGSPVFDLGANYYDYSYGNAINASGTIAGTMGDSTEPFTIGFIWKNDGTGVRELGCTSADFINKSGQVAGFTSTAYRARACFSGIDGTPTVDLGTLGGLNSVPYALNDAGQVAGWSHTRRTVRRHAFVWLNDGSPMKDLGTLGGTESEAHALNSSGQVTGYAYLRGNTVSHAFLWRNDGTKIQDLNTLLDPTDPLKPYVTLTSGELIDDVGDIVADGTDSRTGVSTPYLLQGTVLTLSPRSLAFGNRQIKTASAAKSVTMTNASLKAAAVTSIALTGTASGQFTSTNNCGKSLAGHATCVIKVTFKPTTKGAKSAFLNVNGGGGGLRSVSLTGTGT